MYDATHDEINWKVNKCFDCKFLKKKNNHPEDGKYRERAFENVINLRCYDVSILCLSHFFLLLSFLKAVRHKKPKACHKHEKQLPVILFS